MLLGLVQQIAIILQQEIQNCKTKIYIASFQVAQLQNHLKGDYVNFGFAVLDFMLQDYCNLLYQIFFFLPMQFGAHMQREGGNGLVIRQSTIVLFYKP